jgi:hypothetical protein
MRYDHINLAGLFKFLQRFEKPVPDPRGSFDLGGVIIALRPDDRAIRIKCQNMAATFGIALLMARRGQEIGFGQIGLAQIIAELAELTRINSAGKNDHWFLHRPLLCRRLCSGN